MSKEQSNNVNKLERGTESNRDKSTEAKARHFCDTGGTKAAKCLKPRLGRLNKRTL